MSVREQLDSIAEKRILILDGAMGSMIQALNLDEDDFRGSVFAGHPTSLKGCNDLLCLTKPEAIGSIHNAYLEAGADIIETCSFNSNSVSLSDYGLETLSYKISAAAAGIARASADKFSVSGKPCFVAGSIGPTAKGASLYPDINDPSKRSISWDELEAAYYDNARGLLDGGADILLIETIFDTLNAKAALFAVSRLLEERRTAVPVMLSATVSGESGRLLSGQTLTAFCVSVLHAKPWAIGLNCSSGAEMLLPHIRLLSEIAPCLVSAYPNAGLPNRYGAYEETPETMSAHIETYLKDGLVNIVGGCCGSTPAHIASIAAKAAAFTSRRLNSAPRCGHFSGLEPLAAGDGIVHIGAASADKSNELQSLISKGEYEDAADTARDMVEAGASIIAVETDNENSLSEFLDYALLDPYAAKAPFMITSPNRSVLETGLKRLQGRCLAGPVNLKNGDSEFIAMAELISHYGAAAVVTLIDEQGQAVSCERGIEIAGRAYKLLQENNHPVENIVIAPSTPAGNSSGDQDAVCSWIRENCPGVIVGSCFLCPQSQTHTFNRIAMRSYQFLSAGVNHQVHFFQGKDAHENLWQTGDCYGTHN
ncbi:MAG: homocysteine S-methyltransferase family protein [Spirochaetaceae bacterium]|jgi:5-methyltetrahydrofolate--homocysteine methyltransferase|nr:homocysteine S-methyltransferase family protein [Spirochaetaceae bacterium]